MNSRDSTPTPGSLATTLAGLQQELAQAARDRLTPGVAPVLIGASKGQGADKLAEAMGAGMREFGENKVQEAAAKWPALKTAHPELVLHLIGGLQSNKAAEAVALFDVIQTIDRPKIADAVASEMAKQSRALKLLIQVNTGDEPQKGGVASRELEALVRHYRDNKLPGLTGLMCVPPAEANPAPHFALLQKLAVEFGLPWLSMGMSSDYLTAIRFGATHVRIGTKLFGARN